MSGGAWGLLGELDHEAVAALMAMPVGTFGDLVRRRLDPLWQLERDAPALFDRVRDIPDADDVEGSDVDRETYEGTRQGRVECLIRLPRFSPSCSPRGAVDAERGYEAVDAPLPAWLRRDLSKAAEKTP